MKLVLLAVVVLACCSSIGYAVLAEEVNLLKRAAIADKTKLWPGARVPYTWGTTLNGSKEAVLAAMNEWMKHTCIRFVPKTAVDKAWVEIATRGSGCSANTGYRVGGINNVNLGPGCFSHGTILHELGHALGLHHEHIHPDRDKHVTINWNNVNPTMKERLGSAGLLDKETSWGIAYDPNSVMHYSPRVFGKQGCKGNECIPIISKTGAKIGPGTNLSAKSDIPIVNKMYCSGGK